MLRLLSAAVLLLATADAFTPVDTDCIKWVCVGCGPPPPPSKTPPVMATPLVVGHQVQGDNSIDFQEICTKYDGSKLGHRNGNDERVHVYGSCWIYDHEQIGKEYWLATYNKMNLTWQPFIAGMTPPTNTYKINGLHVGRNHGNETNACDGNHPKAAPYCMTGNVMPGRVSVGTDGSLGMMQYDDYGTCSVESYQLACCGDCTHKFWSCDTEDHTCVAVSNATKPDNKTTFKTQQECAATCIAPPPPPLSAAPCIRFGHAIPVANHVDVTIEQNGGSISFTWKDYKFADFSDWINLFKPGQGTITIYENVGGVRGPALFSAKIPLTPGPLVVVIKPAQAQAFNASGPQPYWPPRDPDQVETIAASYVQPGSEGSLRLFNLSPDTKAAGVSLGGKPLAKDVAFSLGSPWAEVPAKQETFDFTDTGSGKALISKVETPPRAPIGTTSFLLGEQKPGAAGMGITIVALDDAPEGGKCHP